MKYPAQQYDALVRILSQLKEHFDLTGISPSELHYLAFQQSQSDQSQSLNVLRIRDGVIKRTHFLAVGNDTPVAEWTPIVTPEQGFKLYPDGCNDTHIDTAVKRAIKDVEQNTNAA